MGTASSSPTCAPALQVIVNANASRAGGRVAVRAVAALRRAGASAETVRTSSLAELEAACAAVPDRRVVLVGGDGTVHAAANLANPPRELALIPAGRANNVARSLGIPLDTRAAAALAVHGAARPIDLIEARAPSARRVVVESLSVGFLAHARVRYHGRNSADLRAGLRAGAGALRRFRALPLSVSDGGAPEELELSQLFVANLQLYEFGLRVAPFADPTDGLLDVVGITGRSRRSVIRMLLELHRGMRLPHRGVHVWRTPRATIDTGGRSPVVADSMDLGPGPVVVRAMPAALGVVRP
ncbi:MAG: hypothetical protein JW895_06420 [Thermoleophilaceae bacterium]|nr:hypothetical protein [Thermoleophilaceae bacterium]